MLFLVFPEAFTKDFSRHVTKFETIFEKIMFYYIWGALTSFMGSLNALLLSVLKYVKCVENPLPSYFDTHYFILDAIENFNYADKNSLWRIEHAHDTALTVFQVKTKTWKPKPPMTSIDISGIKSPDKIKFQEIKKFCFNQKLPLERSLLVDQEL